MVVPFSLMVAGMKEPLEFEKRRSIPRFARRLLWLIQILIVCTPILLLPGAPVTAQSEKSGGSRQTTPDAIPFRQVIERQGIAVEASIVPLAGRGRVPGTLTEGDEVSVRFRISDSATKLPLGGASPAAWMDRISDDDSERAITCKRRVQHLLGGGIFSRSELDLNVYYVLALNADPTITVVDPLFGFGDTKLLKLIELRSPGEDWVITDDQDRLFVSMPEAGRVAVIRTRSWTVEANLDVGPRPRRLALQPDQAYLWIAVGEDDREASGVSVLRLRDLTVVGHIATGAGAHDIAFTPDSRHAFVTNRDAGTVSVVDIRTLQKARDLDAGEGPVSVVFADLAGAAYVASEDDGRITAIDGGTLERIAQTQAEPGIVQVRVSPGSRFGFVPNPATDTVSILDLSSNRIVQTAKVMQGPDQVSFTDELAYVRHRDSEVVLIIPLKMIEEDQLLVVDVVGGQRPFGRTSRPSLAEAIVQASGANAALIANPGDQAIYYYSEGMAAPMGNFSNYGHEPRAVLVVERNLRERDAGLYETSVRLRRPGEYRLVFFLDVPQIFHCFDLRVALDPAKQAAPKGPRVRVVSLRTDHYFEVGQPLELFFKLTDAATGAPAEDVADMTILVMSPAWQRRLVARHDGAGVYSVDLVIRRAGGYSVLVKAPSMRLDTRLFTLRDNSQRPQ